MSDIAKRKGEVILLPMMTSEGSTVYSRYFKIRGSIHGDEYITFVLMTPNGKKEHYSQYNGFVMKDAFINDNSEYFILTLDDHKQYRVFYDPIKCYSLALERSRQLMRKMNKAKVNTLRLCGRPINEGRLLKNKEQEKPYKTFKDVLAEMASGKVVKLAYKRSGRIVEAFFHLSNGTKTVIEKCDIYGKPIVDPYYFEPLSFDSLEYGLNESVSDRSLSIVLFADRRLPYEEKLKCGDLKKVHDKILDYQGKLSELMADQE